MTFSLPIIFHETNSQIIPISNMSKTYRIWKKDGTSENITAEEISWSKKKSGLVVKADKKTIRNIESLIEVTPPAPKAY